MTCCEMYMVNQCIRDVPTWSMTMLKVRFVFPKNRSELFCLALIDALFHYNWFSFSAFKFSFRIVALCKEREKISNILDAVFLFLSWGIFILHAFVIINLIFSFVPNWGMNFSFQNMCWLPSETVVPLVVTWSSALYYQLHSLRAMPIRHWSFFLASWDLSSGSGLFWF